MSMEGKLSRAMAKVARDVSESTASDSKPTPSPSPAPSQAPKESAEGTVAKATETSQTPPFRCVSRRQGEMAPAIVMMHEPEGEVASQVRGIRGRLLAMNNGNSPSVIVLSSGTRGEGKTTTALNLCLALSEIDSGRVLLIDGDMLCPNVALRAGLNARRGLIDVLESDIDLNDAVYETRIPNLDILPTRELDTSSHSESALHRKTPLLLKELRKYYRFIVIDTPPVLAGSHAMTFGKCADGVLLVAQLERTSRHVVKRAQDELTKAGANVIGCILTHQKHHVPNIIYRLIGASSSRYYRYGYRSHRDAPRRDQDIGVPPAEE